VQVRASSPVLATPPQGKRALGLRGWNWSSTSAVAARVWEPRQAPGAGGPWCGFVRSALVWELEPIDDDLGGELEEREARRFNDPIQKIADPVHWLFRTGRSSVCGQVLKR